jgi:hypothetical protein
VFVFMRKYFYVLTLAAAIASAAAIPTQAQASRTTTTAASPANAQAATNALASLPTSDAVMTVDVRRLLNEALPRAYNNNPTELARVNAEIDKFKARTGLDARSFERVAVGVSYTQTAAGKTLVEPVAIARGTFNAAALVSAARIAANGKIQEQQHAGKTINVFQINDQVKLLGLFNLRVTELAVAALDANTLAIGKVERVRATIDAGANRGGRISPDITALVTRDANAIVALGGNIPQSLTQNLDLGNRNISQSVASIRQFSSTLGTTASGFDLLTILRTENAGAAQTLGSTIAGLKQLAPIFIAQLPALRAKPLQGLIDNTKVVALGSDVQITLALAQVDVAAMIEAF